MTETIGPIQAELRREAEAKRRFLDAQQRRCSSVGAAADTPSRSLSQRRSSNISSDAAVAAARVATPRQVLSGQPPAGGFARSNSARKSRCSATSLVAIKSSASKDSDWEAFQQRREAALETRFQQQEAARRSKESKEIEACTFEPRFYGSKDAAVLRSRSIGSIHTRSAEMEARKAERLKQIRQERFDEEMAHCSFHPRITAAADAVAGGAITPRRRMSAPVAAEAPPTSSSTGYATRMASQRAVVSSVTSNGLPAPTLAHMLPKQEIPRDGHGSSSRNGYASTANSATGDAGGALTVREPKQTSERSEPEAAQEPAVAGQWWRAFRSQATGAAEKNVQAKEADYMIAAVTNALDNMEDYLLAFDDTRSTEGLCDHDSIMETYAPSAPRLRADASPCCSSKLDASTPLTSSNTRAGTPPAEHSAPRRPSDRAGVQAAAAMIAEGFMATSPADAPPASPVSTPGQRGSKEASPGPSSRRASLGANLVFNRGVCTSPPRRSNAV